MANNINNKQYEEKLNAVKQNGFALGYVKDQTPEICMAAVKQNGLALGYVKYQTPEICLTAIKQDINAAKYIKDPEMLKQTMFTLVKEEQAAMKAINKEKPIFEKAKDNDNDREER